MTFYKALYPFYDRIFPLNQSAESFFVDLFKKGESILDIGAGTGSMAIALAEKGLKVTAVEPELEMANTILSKASTKGVSVTVETNTMEEIEDLTENYDGIMCIGNTLPHLQSIEEIENFLKSCYLKLNQGGRLTLQTVNFERFFASSDFSFPIISQEDFKFERKYESKGEKILFTTTLTSSETISNSIPLFPVTSKQILPLLKSIGYKEIKLFGNFMGADYSVDSPAMIVVASKIN